MLKKIIWEAWIDPYHSNIEDFGGKSVGNQTYLEKTHNGNSEGEDWKEEKCQEDKLLGINFNKVVGTPYGLLSITDDTLVSSKFEFWIIHTNFDLTPPVVSAIENIPGVETLEVYTRYRARIGFPKSGLFNVQQTKQYIQKLVDELNKSSLYQIYSRIEKEFGTKKIEEFELVYNNKLKNSDYWSVYICPNGMLDVVMSKDYNEDYTNKISILGNTQTLIGGILINSSEL